MLDVLYEDHQTANLMHQEVDSLCLQWLADDALARESCQRLGELLVSLKGVYERHIAVEDTKVFPLARRLLDISELQAIATEMASRRGIDLQTRGGFSTFS